MDFDSQQLTENIFPLPTPQTSLDGMALKRLVEAGLNWLRANQQIVNALNVFPVPDGDTGTNMVLTMQAALAEIANLNETNFGKVAHQIAQGALMGARGNSGVILSQLWRGFSRSVDSQEYLDAGSFVQALSVARDTAYKGVVRPVEGTILTVSKDIAAAAEKALDDSNDLAMILKIVVEEADRSVLRTPELLPVLKEAGVVDSGGKGLFFIFEGMLRHINGLSLEEPISIIQPIDTMALDTALETIEPGQDVEVVIDFAPREELNLKEFYARLEEMGTSIQLGEGEDIYRIHIHVPEENQNAPLDYIKTIGIWKKVALENLKDQMKAIESSKIESEPPYEFVPVEPDHIAVIAVVPGDGIARVFASLNVAAIVSGGQTMNPSTQEIIASFENLPTDKIVILPNNKNIIHTAEAARELSVKQVRVIPTRTIPQGLAALLRLIPHGDLDTVVGDMLDAIDDVDTGEITLATRSVTIDGVKVKHGQFIALFNGKIVVSEPTLEAATLGLIKSADIINRELITIFYGDDVTYSEASRIRDLICETYPHLEEVEIKAGGQPHYKFIMAIE